LKSLADRTGVQDLSVFVTAIVQAEQLGASIVSVLRIQSNEMRIRRRQRAEVLAHQAPIKMLFPMAFLIFPPMFVVILGPAIPTVAHLFLPNVFL
jgi:tight adherence protein C